VPDIAAAGAADEQVMGFGKDLLIVLFPACRAALFDIH